MGYYGEILPLPGITKEADQSLWSEGFRYLGDFAEPYMLYLPLFVIAVALILRDRAGEGSRRERQRVELAPIVAGILSCLYVVRVGGDFMHARMLLPATLLFLLPAFVVKVNHRAMAIGGVVVIWAVVCGVAMRVSYQGQIAADGIADERGAYVGSTGSSHPDAPSFSHVFDETYSDHPPAESAGEIVISPALMAQRTLPLRSDLPYGSAYVEFHLGTAGAGLPLDDAAIDPLGLAYPLVAHFEPEPGRPGHSKEITPEWLIADYTPPGTPIPPGVDAARVAAARHVLTCGPVKDLLDASRAPMSWSRFWKNLLSAPGRSSLRIPRDPLAAEAKFC
jgi:arabinofuranosyltransferase